MIKKKGQPITGTNTAMAPKAPVLGNQADTSRVAQKMVLRPPEPFGNQNSTAQSPPSGKASGGISTTEPHVASGLTHQSPGAKALPQGGPIGQSKMPNQSGQIGGKMGWPPPKRKAGTVSGFKSKRGAAFYGE